MNLDVSRASSFGSRDWAVYGEVGSNKMDRVSSASNLDENFTPALLNCSNVVRSLGYIQSTQSDRLGHDLQQPLFAAASGFPTGSYCKILVEI